MSNYNSIIEQNNLDLTSILSTINELPEAAASVETCTVVITSHCSVDYMPDFWAYCYSDEGFYICDASGEIAVERREYYDDAYGMDMYQYTCTISNVARNSPFVLNTEVKNALPFNIVDSSGLIDLASGVSSFFTVFQISSENGGTATVLLYQ